MENGVANVANAIVGSGFEIHVCTLRNRGEFAARMPDPSLVVSLDKEPGFSVRWIRRLRRQMLTISPDLVHTHNLGPLIDSVCATGFGRTYPILHGEHAELAPAETSRKKILLRRFLYRACRRIHTVSASLTEHLASSGMPRDRMETITNGVDTLRFSPDGATENPFGENLEELTVIGNVGRFGEFKRHLELIEAFENLAPRHEGLRLLLVGDGGPVKAATLERIERSSFADRIRWAGYQAEPAPFYRAMDILVVPSSNEGLSNASLEAIACGTPVLANDSCGAREVIEGDDVGAVASMDGVAGIEIAIESMLRDEVKLASMRATARAHAEKRFSLSAMADRYRKLYDRCSKRRA